MFSITCSLLWRATNAGRIFANGGISSFDRVLEWVSLGKPSVFVSNTGGVAQACSHQTATDPPPNTGATLGCERRRFLRQSLFAACTKATGRIPPQACDVQWLGAWIRAPHFQPCL